MQFREQTTEPPNSLQQTTHHSDSGEQFEAAHFALFTVQPDARAPSAAPLTGRKTIAWLDRVIVANA
jgi:hypothetical protein